MMDSISTIGILYSYAPHFRKAVQHLRNAYPNARIIAFVPPSFPEDALSAYVDEQHACVPEPQQPKTMQQSWQLLQEIRKQQLDLFVVLFKSSRLQGMSALSGAKESCCYDMSGALTPVRLRPFHAFFGGIFRRVRGQLLYWRIWLNVHCTSITARPLEDSSSPDAQEKNHV